MGIEGTWAVSDFVWLCLALFALLVKCKAMHLLLGEWCRG